MADRLRALLRAGWPMLRILPHESAGSIAPDSSNVLVVVEDAGDEVSDGLEVFVVAGMLPTRELGEGDDPTRREVRLARPSASVAALFGPPARYVEGGPIDPFADHLESLFQ